MKYSKLFSISLIMLSLLTSKALAQKDIGVAADTYDPEALYEFRFVGGNSFQGKILAWDETSLLIKTDEFGQITVEANNIKSIQLIDTNTLDSKYLTQNPNDTRYFFGPSARPIGKGEGYYQNVMASGNFINYGLTPYFSIGGGIELITTILSISSGFDFAPLVFLTPKVAIAIDERNAIGAGLLAASIDGIVAGLAYGVYTLGTADLNMTVGGGYGSFYFLGDNPDGIGLFSLSVMARVSNKVYLMTENYWLAAGEDSGGVVSYGVRIANNRNSWDLGFINNPAITESFIVGIPYLSFVRRF